MPQANSAIKATIKRASKKARAQTTDLDKESQAKLANMYQHASDQIKQTLLQHASENGTVNIEVLQNLLDQVHGVLDVLSNQRGDLLEQGLHTAASLGSAAFSSVTPAETLFSIQQAAVTYVMSFMAADGLQLSDRIWRIDRHARDVVESAIQQAVIQGKSASQAADDFLQRGEHVPAKLLEKMKKADADRIGREAGKALLHGPGSPRNNAMRLFRTEINRAHGESFQAAAFSNSNVIGLRFLLSPNHRHADICDMHASVNRYGLGKGVYPDGKNPWPAHPNTISFTEVVFADEVTDEDRQGKETRVDFIKKQPASLRTSILGGQKKRAAFDDGHIPESSIATPWHVVKKRLERKGVNVKEKLKKKDDVSILSGVKIIGERADLEHALASLHDDHLALIHKLPKPEMMQRLADKGFYRRSDKLLVSNPLADGGDVTRHEYGHHIDYELSAHQHGGFYSMSEMDRRFLHAYNEDKKLLGLKSSQTKFTAMQNLHDRLYTTKDKTLRSGRVIRRAEINDIGLSGISDMIDSLTAGLFQASHGGYGHGKAYYKKRGNRHKENFANLFYLRGTKHWPLAEELFPNLTKSFVSIIKEGIQR